MTMSSLASRLTLCHTGSHARQTVCSCTIRGKQKGAGKSAECVVKNSISLRITLLKINRLSASAAASGCSCKPRKRREPARSAFLRIAVPAREPAPRRSLDAHSRQDLQKPCETAEQGSANRYANFPEFRGMAGTGRGTGVKAQVSARRRRLQHLPRRPLPHRRFPPSRRIFEVGLLPAFRAQRRFLRPLALPPALPPSRSSSLVCPPGHARVFQLGSLSQLEWHRFCPPSASTRQRL